MHVIQLGARADGILMKVDIGSEVLEEWTKEPGSLFSQHLYGPTTLCMPGTVPEYGDTAVNKIELRSLCLWNLLFCVGGGR